MKSESADPEWPHRADYGRGVYRRRIVLEARSGQSAGSVSPGCVEGELADDFHHFALRLDFDGESVQCIEGEDVRVPWATCPGAVSKLEAFEGAPLRGSLRDLQRFTPARAQCTHLHDLAILAARHAARVSTDREARRVRRIDVAMPDRVEGRTTASLHEDDREVLRWSLAGDFVEAATPAAFRGIPLAGRGFHAALKGLDDPLLEEAAWILQRAIFVGQGRRHDFDRMATAEAFAPIVGPACHTFDPGRRGRAFRIRGSVRDFSHEPDRIFERGPTGQGAGRRRVD